MGKIDAESKKYLSINRIFADAFNYLIYDGEQVIKPEALRAVDTTEIAAPFGSSGKRLPIQRFRDTLKIWAATEDDDLVYVILGGEAQARVHYAMPVKDMLYDSINYASQVSETQRSHRHSGEGALTYDNGELKVKLTAEEFLSGFAKGDKLMPIVTAVIYFGDEEWDAPLSIHEMLRVPDKRVLRVIPNYFINLIAPADMDEHDFGKFHTDLGLAMKVIKHQRSGVAEIIKETNHRKIDRDTAEFLNTVVNLNLEYVEPNEEGKVDMCLAMEIHDRKISILGYIKALRSVGIKEDDIVTAIVKEYSITTDYAKELMNAA